MAPSRHLPLSLVLGLLSTAAQATEGQPAPARVALEWQDSTQPACLTRRQLTSAVDSLLSRKAFGDTPADVVVHGSMTQDEQGVRTARLELRRPDGTVLGVRNLRAADQGCRSLREGVPIALSLMIDTRRIEALLQLPKEQEPPRPAQRSEEQERKPRPPAPSPPLEDTPSKWHSEMEAGVSWTRGHIPGTSTAGWFAVALAHASGSALRVQGRLVAPHTEDYSGGGVTVWAWQADVGGSFRFYEGSWLRLDALGLFETGEMLSRGSDFEINKTDRSWLAAGLAGGRGSIPLGNGWFTGLTAWCGVPLLAQRVTYRTPQGKAELTSSSDLFTQADVFIGIRSF